LAFGGHCRRSVPDAVAVASFSQASAVPLWSGPRLAFGEWSGQFVAAVTCRRLDPRRLIRRSDSVPSSAFWRTVGSCRMRLPARRRHHSPAGFTTPTQLSALFLDAVRYRKSPVEQAITDPVVGGSRDCDRICNHRAVCRWWSPRRRRRLYDDRTTDDRGVVAAAAQLSGGTSAVNRHKRCTHLARGDGSDLRVVRRVATPASSQTSGRTPSEVASCLSGVPAILETGLPLAAAGFDSGHSLLSWKSIHSELLAIDAVASCATSSGRAAGRDLGPLA